MHPVASRELNPESWPYANWFKTSFLIFILYSDSKWLKRVMKLYISWEAWVQPFGRRTCVGHVGMGCAAWTQLPAHPKQFFFSDAARYIEMLPDIQPNTSGHKFKTWTKTTMAWKFILELIRARDTPLEDYYLEIPKRKN